MDDFRFPERLHAGRGHCNSDLHAGRDGLSPPDRRWPAWGVASAMVLAFALRVLNAPQVFTAHGVRFVEDDAFYHMRRVFLALSHGFRIPDFDLYLNFPAGLRCIWSPLLDAGLAATAFAVGLGHPSPHRVECVSALAPAVLGALTVLPVFIAARHLLPAPAALLAAVALALNPAHIQITVLGRPDHHAAISLIAAILFARAIGREGEAPRRAAVLDGVLLFLALGTWTGALMLVALAFGGTAIRLGLRLRRPALLAAETERGAVTYLTAAALLLPLCACTSWGRAGESTWAALSAFQPMVLTACAALATLPWLVRRATGSGETGGGRRCRAAAWTLLGLALAALALAVLRGGLMGRLAEGPAFMTRQDALLQQVEESLPLTLSGWLSAFSGISLAYPLLIMMAISRRPPGGRRESAAMFAFWAASTGAMTLMQQRFADVFAVPAAVMDAWFAALCWSAAGVIVCRLRPAWGRLARPTIVAAVLALAALPTARALRAYARSAPRYSFAPLYDLCTTLREQTPATAGYDDGARPEYSVMAPWPMGHALVYLARRPNVANNFVGLDANHEANRMPARFFTSDDPAAACALLDACRTRYVVVAEPIESGDFVWMLRAIGMDEADFFQARPGPAGTMFTPTRRCLNSMALRLYFSDREWGPFRLCFDSNERVRAAGRERPRYRVFEYRGIASWP